MSGALTKVKTDTVDPVSGYSSFQCFYVLFSFTKDTVKVLKLKINYEIIR